MGNFEKITISVFINAPIEKVWNYYTNPVHIVNWNAASDDWHTTKATNDLRIGGSFLSTMEAKDGSFSFDFEGIYENVIPNQLIAYNLADNRNIQTIFINNGDSVQITTIFEAETENPIELQKGGWQAILDNFKKYTEA